MRFLPKVVVLVTLVAAVLVGATVNSIENVEDPAKAEAAAVMAGKVPEGLTWGFVSRGFKSVPQLGPYLQPRTAIIAVAYAFVAVVYLRLKRKQSWLTVGLA